MGRNASFSNNPNAGMLVEGCWTGNRGPASLGGAPALLPRHFRPGEPPVQIVRFTINGDTFLEAARLGAPRRLSSAVRRGLQVVRPRVPLRYVRPEEGEVLFFRGPPGITSSFPSAEYTHLQEFAVRLTPEGGARREGVVRAAVNFSSVTSMTRELADLLGLEYRGLGGLGGRNLIAGHHTVSILTDPIDLEVLDLDGRAAYTMTAHLVFVDHWCNIYDMQIGHDLIHEHGLIYSSDGNWGICAQPPGARSSRDAHVSLGGAPALIPRSRRRGERRYGTCTFTVEPDTHAEALQLVAARAAVRARRAAAAQGNDPQAAAAAAHAAAAGAAADGHGGGDAGGSSGRQQPAPGPSLVPGSAAWVEEWLPQQFRQQRGRGGRAGGGRAGGGGGGGGGHGGRRRGGRGRGRGRGPGRGLGGVEAAAAEED